MPKPPKKSKYPLHNRACDICSAKSPTLTDTATSLGPWGHLCPACLEQYGIPSIRTEFENIVS